MQNNLNINVNSPDQTPKAKQNKQIDEALAGLLDRGTKDKVKVIPNVLREGVEGVDTGNAYSWGLMSEFMDCYDKGNTDPNCLRWGFLSLLGIIKGRDCYVNFGGRPVYPNLYTAFVGNPGCGKSTALTVIKDLLQELGYPSTTPEIVEPNKLAYYFGKEYKGSRVDALPVEGRPNQVNQTARENFLDSFKQDELDPLTVLNIRDRHSGHQLIARSRLEELDHDCLTIISSELMGTIPPNAKWYVNKILIDLYDAHDHDTYEVAEGVILDQPIINLLGGITPTGLATTFNVSDFNTGLLTRIMLVHHREIEKGDPFAQTHDYKASTELLHSINRIYDFKGEITLTAEARQTYKLIDMTQYNAVYDTRLSFYYNRRSLFLVKVSMLIALMHGRTEIEKKDMVTANTLLLYTEYDMPKTLSSFGNTPSIKIRNTIIEFLEGQIKKANPTLSKDIVEHVSNKLGVSRESAITVELQKLISTGVVNYLLMGDANQFFLSKPKNTDIIEALKAGVADYEAIPEWNISDYELAEEELDQVSVADWSDIDL